jgi:hypothetical protein
MSLLEKLRNVGQQFGLVRVVASKLSPTPTGTPHKLTTRTITLKDLDAEIEAQELKTLGQLPSDVLVEIEQVLLAAGIKPGMGSWSVPRLQQVIGSDALKNQDRKHIQAEILNQLAADKASVEDIVRDALARDRAIDTYDAMVHRKMVERQELRQRRCTEIQDQIAVLQEEAGRLAQESKADGQYFHDWHRKKVGYEIEMAKAINYILDKPVITIEEHLPDNEARPAR